MGPLTMELAALEHLKNWCLHVFSVAFLAHSDCWHCGVNWPWKKQLLSYLKTIQNILMTLLDGSQVSDRCPLGYLFYFTVHRRYPLLSKNAPFNEYAFTCMFVFFKPLHLLLLVVVIVVVVVVVVVIVIAFSTRIIASFMTTTLAGCSASALVLVAFLFSVGNLNLGHQGICSFVFS